MPARRATRPTTSSTRSRRRRTATPRTSSASMSDDPESGFWKVRNLIPAVPPCHHAAVPHAGLPRGQHQARRRLRAVQQPVGPQAGVVRPVGPRARATTPPAPARARSSPWAARAGSTRSCASSTTSTSRASPRRSPTRRSRCSPATGPGARRRGGRRRQPHAGHRADPGSYADDNGNAGTGSGAGQGIWSISAPLPYDVHFAGEPHVTADVTAPLPDANLVADVYDIDAAGKATLVSRGAQLVRASGLQAFDLYGEDWLLKAGHRIGVLLTSSNSEWWTHVPTQQTVTVTVPASGLPFLSRRRVSDLTGTISAKLAAHRGLGRRSRSRRTRSRRRHTLRSAGAARNHAVTSISSRTCGGVPGARPSPRWGSRWVSRRSSRCSRWARGSSRRRASSCAWGRPTSPCSSTAWRTRRVVPAAVGGPEGGPHRRRGERPHR